MQNRARTLQRREILPALDPKPIINQVLHAELARVLERWKEARLVKMKRIAPESQIQHFIAKRGLNAILDQIKQHVECYFPGSTTRMELDEIQLVVYICTTLPGREAFQRLNLFDHEWWVDRYDGSICVTLEIQKQARTLAGTK